MKKLTALLVTAAMLVTLATACGTSGDNAAGTTTGAATTAGTESQVQRTDLNMVIETDIATLHPSDFSTTVEIDATRQIYDTLMYYPQGSATDPQPRIAKSYKVSDDGLTYTFELRDDVTFHNGKPLTAKDVQFSAELYKASPYQASKVNGMESVEAVGDYTVVFKTQTPFSPFLSNICTLNIASKDYYEEAGKEKFGTDPVGSGPYQFASHELGNKLVLKAYEGYYRGVAKIKDVTIKIIPDSTTAAIALQTGEADYLKIQQADYATLEKDKNITLAKAPVSTFGFVTMNHEAKPFDNVKVRQAVAYCIDRQNMIDIALEGFGTVNSNILSPYKFGYSKDQPQYDYNVEKAKALLAEAGIAVPYNLGKILAAEKYSKQAQVLQNDLAAIGLNAEIEIMEFNAYITELRNGKYVISPLQITLEGDTSMLEMVLASKYIGAANNARYKNPEIDRWFGEAVSAIDDAKRLEIYNKIFTRAQEDAVYASMYNPIDLSAYSSSLKVPEFPLEGDYFVYDFSW